MFVATFVPPLSPEARVRLFLVHAGAVWCGVACFTPLGCEYLGVPFRFPYVWEGW